MTDTRQAWSEVADQLDALALKLKLHAKEELSKETEVRSSFDRVGVAMKEACDAIGDAARDPAVRADLQATADSFAAALSATVEQVATALKTRPPASP